jgi:uncharacterized protein YbaA (DUF1428 family)
MGYIDGFVIPVKTAERQAFIDHATRMDAFFLDEGALRVIECWQADVREGKTTDFFGAVNREPDESVAFSWVEWPDKATRDAAFKRMEANEAMMAEPMPFDGKRMIFGGFEPIVERGTIGRGRYVQGFIVPVPEGKREAYRKMADDAWGMFEGYGALRVVEAWADDVPAGKVTDFRRAVKAEDGEIAVFSFLEWPSREVCDAAAAKMESGEGMDMPENMEMPFDGKRMVYGGFTPVVELEK